MKLIVAALYILVLASCRQGDADSAWWSNEKTIIELQNQLELAKYRGGNTPPAEDVPVDNSEALRLGIATMLVEKRGLTKEISNLQNGWDEFRKEILQTRRNKTSGMTFDEFETSGNRHFKDVRITRIDDTGISLTHTSGTARLRFSDLDAHWQSYFGLDAELGQEAQELETERRTAYEHSIDTQLAVISENEAELRKERKREEESLASARALAFSAKPPTTRPLSASVGALGETSSIYGSRRYGSISSYYRRPVVRYNYFSHCRPSSYGIPFFDTGIPTNRNGGCVHPIEVRAPFNPSNP